MALLGPHPRDVVRPDHGRAPLLEAGPGVELVLHEQPLKSPTSSPDGRLRFSWLRDCVAHRFGIAADHRERVQRHPSDMTDAEWAAIRPLLPVPAWLQGRGGQPEGYCHRQMLVASRRVV